MRSLAITLVLAAIPITAHAAPAGMKKPVRAAEAVKLVKPKQTWPVHYGTFPALAGNPTDFGVALKKTGARTVLVPKQIGESLLLSSPL